MFERAYAGIQQVGRGETVLEVWIKTCLWSENAFQKTEYVSCFFHIRHYVGVNIWTSKRLQSMPSALKILSAQKKRLMDWWTWPGRNLSNCWRSGNYQVTFLIIWLIFQIWACLWLSQKEFIVCQQFNHLHTTLNNRLFPGNVSSLNFWYGGIILYVVRQVSDVW